MHPKDRENCIWDYEAIADSIDQLREEFGDRLFVGFGIEVCYQSTVMAEILKYLDEHDFDFVLLSIHWCDKKPLHVHAHWTEVGCRETTRLYLESVLEALQFCLQLKEKGERPFDVLGHLDLVKRYSQRYWNEFNIEVHKDLMDEILRTAIAANVIPEINTSTLRDNVGEPMPAAWTVARYEELGGQAMSIGSDAHRSENIAAGFDAAIQVLKQAGIETEAVFSERTGELIPL